MEPKTQQTPRFPRLCAHRGLSEACPENTLPAFAAAMASGAQEIEFDLWLSRDGVPAVLHDERVERTTDGTGNVTEMDWAYIRRLDAGIRCGAAWRGVRIPRFEEVLDLIDGRVELNIHIKDAGPDGQLVKRVCDLLRERTSPPAYIAGCTERVLQAAMDYAPELPRACLLAQDDPSAQVRSAQVYACRRVQFPREVSVEQIRQARDAGLVCNLFWSDNAVEAADYVRRGIDVVLTNCAHILIADNFEALAARRGQDIA